MKTVYGKILAVAVGVAAAVACGKGATGTLTLGIKDGPPVSSDGRTISSLQIDITRITLRHGDDAEEQDGGAANAQGEDDVVVFDAGSAAPRTVDLLKVTTFSQLVATLQVPAGTYVGAEVVVSGARVVFADAPATTVALQLEGEGHHGKSDFEFHFKPHVVVSTSGATLAVVDFVPVVVKDAAGNYHLSHDGVNDDSGEKGDQDEIELEGTIASLVSTATSNTLTIAGSSSVVVFTNARIRLKDVVVPSSSLALGQKIEVEGKYDPATGHVIADSIRIE